MAACRLDGLSVTANTSLSACRWRKHRLVGIGERSQPEDGMQQLQSRAWRALVLPLLFVTSVASAQAKITSPKEFFGHNIGDDYWLATYDQFRSEERRV